jgi:DEAD/DEAH box helicase domain-containing protein
MDTQVTWVEIDDEIIQEMKETATTSDDQSQKEAVLGGLHGVKNGVISLAPLELRMDKQDLGGLAELHHPERDWNGGFFIYDGVSGGVGFARAIYENFESIGKHVHETITTCSCTGLEGCPACIMESTTGSGNEPLNTSEAIKISTLLTEYTE